MISISNLFKKNKFVYLLLGFLAGIICGFLGTGGGIILIFALKFLKVRDEEKCGVCGVDDTKISHDTFAQTIVVMIILSLSSAIFYLIRGDFTLKSTLPYLPSAAIGGVVGAFLMDKLKAKWLNKIFAALVIWAGIFMII